MVLWLARGIVVLLAGIEPHGREHGRHLGAQVRHVLDRRHRQRRARARPMPAVADVVAGARVVGALLGVDPEKRLVGGDGEAHVVEHAELGLRRDQDALGDAARGELRLGALGDRARAALVAEAGGRLGDVADQDQAGLGAERIEHCGGEIGLQQHVGLADVAPAGERRAVEHHAVLEQRLRSTAPAATRDVLPLAAQVGEPEIDGAHVVGPDLLENGCDIRHDHVPTGACALSPERAPRATPRFGSRQVHPTHAGRRPVGPWPRQRTWQRLSTGWRITA